MRLLLPAADGIADHAERRIGGADILRCGAADETQLAGVTFYCLPYMGDAGNIALAATMPRLRVIQSLSSGVDDVLGLVPSEVTVCNGRGLYHEESTAELAVGLTLASVRRLPCFVHQQRRHVWHHMRTDTVGGKRVLLVGYGTVGAAISRRLEPFGAHVIPASRTVRHGVAPLTQLATLATTTDIMIVCIALTVETRGLVDERVLAALPDGALIVNVARGPVIDTNALAKELLSGRLHAALDVIEPEPLPRDRTEWTASNLLLTPHIGGDTFEFARRAANFVTEQAVRHLRGSQLLNVVQASTHLTERQSASSGGECHGFQ